MRHFEKAYENLRKARVLLSAATAMSFPQGSVVFYDHGGYGRQGMVEQTYEDRIRIITPNEKKIWIDAVRVKRVSR
jgi:hypothetical protein